MNKKLIINNKEAFNHWLAGGSVVFQVPNGDSPVWVEEPEYNDAQAAKLWHNFCNVVINDEYVHLRKHLAEDGTVECYNIMGGYWHDMSRSNDQWNNFQQDVKHYRIKPDEPQFAVGDWVTWDSPARGMEIHQITSLPNCSQSTITDYIYSPGGRQVTNTLLTPWQPQPNSYCWCWDFVGISPRLCKLDHITDDGKYMFDDGTAVLESFKHYEPFIGNLPSCLSKDN